jgi:hypothetical protein
LQVQKSRIRFPALPDFLRSRGSGTRSTQPREDNWGANWVKKKLFRSRKLRLTSVGIRCADLAKHLYPRMLPLTLPKNFCRSVGLARLGTKSCGVYFVLPNSEVSLSLRSFGRSDFTCLQKLHAYICSRIKDNQIWTRRNKGARHVKLLSLGYWITPRMVLWSTRIRDVTSLTPVMTQFIVDAVTSGNAQIIRIIRRWRQEINLPEKKREDS